jgi:AraC family transcriptional regulator
MKRNLIGRSAQRLTSALGHPIDRVFAERQSSEVLVSNNNRSALLGSRSLAPDKYTSEEISATEDGLVVVREIPDRSGDHIIRSLTCALEAVVLEHDEHCAEALRRTIEARLAGLGPAMRATDCRSDADSIRPAIRALQKWRLKRVVEYVDANLSSRVSLLDLAAVAGLSRMHFACQFRAATGLRPHEFLLQRRVCRSKELMKGTSMTIAEIALTVGFLTQAHFTTVFKRFVGYTPRQWRTANQLASVPRKRDTTTTETTTTL